MARPPESLRDKSGHGHDGKPEADLGLPEIVDSDGGQALRLDGRGWSIAGPWPISIATIPYSLGHGSSRVGMVPGP